MTANELITALKEWITPLSALLIVIASIIDSSKKIAAQPLSKALAWLGKKLNADISNRLDGQEAFLLNDFYQKHKNGKRMTQIQYENAIKMFEEHITRGANSVDAQHLQELKEYYRNTFFRTQRDK